jgi:hypothetical protein
MQFSALPCYLTHIGARYLSRPRGYGQRRRKQVIIIIIIIIRGLRANKKSTSSS